MYKCHFLNTYPTLPTFYSIDTFTLHIVSLKLPGSSPFICLSKKGTATLGAAVFDCFREGLPKGNAVGKTPRETNHGMSGWMGFSVGFLVATWIFCGEFCFGHEFHGLGFGIPGIFWIRGVIF